LSESPSLKEVLFIGKECTLLLLLYMASKHISITNKQNLMDVFSEFSHAIESL